MNIPKMASIVQAQLAQREITISYRDAIQLVKPIRKPMWDWHFYLGYILTGLLSFRLGLHFAKTMKFQSPFSPSLKPIERFKNSCYLVFYTLFFTSLVTGIVMKWGPKEYKHDIEAYHELSIYYLIGYIFIHLGGVLLQEIKPIKK